MFSKFTLISQILTYTELNVAIIAYHTFCVSRDDVLTNGPTYKTDGFIKANPAVSIMKDQQVQLFKVFDLLGMSPKARKTMSQMLDSTEESPLKSFLIKKETREIKN